MTEIATCAVELRERCTGTGEFSIDDILFVKWCLGASLTPFTLIAVLREALGAPLELLRAVENWEGASSAGDMSTDEAAALINRWWAPVAGREP